MSRQPFLFEVRGRPDFKLLVGFASELACVQHSAIDGEPPYLMAVERADRTPLAMTPFTFLIDDTATEIPVRYAISSESAISIIEHFLATGGRHPDFSWESI